MLYCGGTWKGLESRLGYIQEMGFDTGVQILQRKRRGEADASVDITYCRQYRRDH